MEAYSRTSSSQNQSHSVLHSVRKSNSKPWKKGPVAPPAPAAIRVYEVDVMNFRELVQQLTGAPESKPDQQIVQNVAPAVLPVGVPLSSAVSAKWYQGGQSQEINGRKKLQGLLELNLSSPSSYSWASSLP